MRCIGCSSSIRRDGGSRQNLLSRNTGTYVEARVGGQLFSCGAFEISHVCNFGGGLPRGLGRVPKPSNEHEYFDAEYQGRNGTLESVSKPDTLGKVGTVIQPPPWVLIW